MTRAAHGQLLCCIAGTFGVVLLTSSRHIESSVCTLCHTDTPDGERFAQRLAGRFLDFAPISQVSRQKSSNIHAIY
jgi:hypothetical protein